MIKFTKVWAEDKDGKKGMGSKTYYHDPRNPVEGIEGCKINDGQKEVECTKIFHTGGKYIILKGTPMEFMQTCKEAEMAICLLSDLYSHGMTIKQFLEQNAIKTES
jgi:hypothetical protein